MEAMTEKTLDKTALRDFAVNARKKLKERIELQANLMGFYEDNRQVNYEFEDDKFFKINGETFSKKQAQKLREQITKKSFATVIDEVAYTWFNRFIALYYMEVNGYSENNCNIISNLSNISQYAVSIASLLSDEEKQSIIENINNSKEEPIFKTLIIHQCNVMNKKLPFLFEEINNYTELLFPSGLLNNDSVIREMLAIDKSNWQVVEIIGWLYQYYNQDEKDRVIQAKKRYKVNEIPYATQLFTPKWIVKYMTQNSLGRLWQEAHPTSTLKDSMEFYLEPRKLTDEDKQELETHIMKGILPEQIKVFDPACGSGHILVYAYSLLYEMYKESGYIETDIPSLILKNNLFGLDICKRASHFAQLAVLFRARQDDKNIFDKYEELNIRCIENTDEFTNNELSFLAGETNGESFDKVSELVDCFRYANIYGSLCKYPQVDYEFYEDILEKLKGKYSDSILVNPELIYDKFEPLVKQFKILKQQYECVITNPPYMGNKYMPPMLSDFIFSNYKEAKYDLFTVFIQRAIEKCTKKGYIGAITPIVWFFTKSYETTRNYCLDNTTFTSIIQLEHNGFEVAAIPVITFTLRKGCINYPAECIKLSDFPGIELQYLKVLEANQKEECNYRYTAYNSNFNSLPGKPFAFWITSNTKRVFETGTRLGDIADIKQGMTTSNNALFVRYWHEISKDKFSTTSSSLENARLSQKKWFPYNKGGYFRKWYGNVEEVVNYYNDGMEVKEYTSKLPQGTDVRIKSRNFYFKEALTWTFIAINFGVRYIPVGYIFDVAGSSLFPKSNDIYYIMGFLCCKIANTFMYLLNPTMNFQTNNVASLPIIFVEDATIKNKIDKLVNDNIAISINDWDSFETSWNFQEHPLLRFKENGKVSDSFNRWKEYKQEQFNKLKANEEELNKLFIEIYGLQDEMTPEVDDKDITVALADETRDIKSLMSYAVGCMLGRYSLDEKGLAFAGGEFDSSKYKTLEVDEDGILPILSDTWFEDDIVEEFKRFLKKAFGELYFNENMQYIADVLGRKGSESAEDRIRTYYLKDFYKDHLQTYKKRPIYWMFTSGKEKAFNCLMYLHRYDKTTLSRIRKDYLHEYQAKLDRAKAQAEDEGNVKLNSLYSKYQSEILEYDRKLQVLADSQIELDLDDGVKVNYAKFKGLLEAEKDVVGRGK